MSNKSQQEIAAPTNARIHTEKNTTRKLTIIATMVAMSILFKVLGNSLSFFTPNLKFSLSYTGWLLAAVILGPLGGAVVAGISDVLGTMIVPSGYSINPFMVLGSMSIPLAAGLFYKYLPFKNKALKLTIGTLFGSIIGTLGINSLSLYYMLGMDKTMSFFMYVLTLRTPQLIFVGLNLVITISLLPMVYKLKLVEATVKE